MALEDAVAVWRFCLFRTGGLLLSAQVESSLTVSEEDVLFVTSTFSLCELLSLRPSLLKSRKVFYLALFSLSRCCIFMKTSSTIPDVKKKSVIFSLDGFRSYHVW